MYRQLFVGFILLFTITMASENSVQVLRANADFGKNLYQVLANDKGNIIFSPLSAHTILALAYQGAAGKTAESFARTLNLPETKSAATGYKEVMSSLNNVQNVTLHIANKVYLKTGYKLKDSFGQVARDSFYSEVEQVNFAEAPTAAKAINSWVEGKTNSKITNLIDPSSLDALTRLVLVNAIYFKGNWKHKFDKTNTKNEPFYLNDQDKIEVPMMHITKKFNYGESQELDAKILELPYSNEDLSMVIVLPNQKNGIKALEQKLATTDLTTLTKNLYEREVQVTLPKFKIESKIDLKPILEKMGLGVIFTDDADFTGLLESPEPLVVSEVIQKAFIEVNEEGAEAAAATGVQMRLKRSLVTERHNFVADHPFLYCLVSKLVLEDTDDVSKLLFFGRVVKPPETDGSSSYTHSEL